MSKFMLYLVQYIAFGKMFVNYREFNKNKLLKIRYLITRHLNLNKFD